MTALMSIPKDMYEAAQIDGAKWYHIVTRIELPMIRNTVLVGVIFRIIDNFRLFDIVFATTRGGQGAQPRSLVCTPIVKFFSI
jgi:multiple sugar transport system permease protein